MISTADVFKNIHTNVDSLLFTDRTFNLSKEDRLWQLPVSQTSDLNTNLISDLMIETFFKYYALALV